MGLGIIMAYLIGCCNRIRILSIVYNGKGKKDEFMK